MEGHATEQNHRLSLNYTEDENNKTPNTLTMTFRSL